MNTELIVKVQLSINSSDYERYMLVYNEDRTIEYEKPVTDKEIKALGNKPKSFWYASHRKDGVIVLQGLAPWQEW